jgi:transposase InsO family protein
MGLCLRRVVLHDPMLGWQGSTGISGSFQSESVAILDWNRWQGSTGISGNLRPEYAAVTATFRILYVFVVIEHVSRRLLHVNVTAHPTAEWTLQQLREAIPSNHTYRFLIYDRDSIFSQPLDQHIRHLGLRVLKTPVRRPQANALCERLLGTLRRECLDFIIPLTESHLRRLLQEWVPYYNTSRPHMSLVQFVTIK